MERSFPDERYNTGARIWIEQDARVAYAYWFNAEGPVQGDVWLYNLKPTPEAPPWKTGRKIMPFLNSEDYIDRSLHPASVQFDRLAVEWRRETGVVRANIRLNGVPIASLAKGEKPGKSRLVTRDGPLARKDEIQTP
jgi:hypothetical protein